MVNSIIIYILLNFILLLIASKISYKLNLVDLPDKRKMHSKKIPNTGGIVISICLVISNFLFEGTIKDFNLILSISFLIALTGLFDDIYNLNVGNKLSLQIIPIFYLIFFGNISLDQLGNYYYFKIQLGTFGLPFTLLCVLFLVNSFNYFDGIDGLLSLASISVIIILYFLVADSHIRLYFIIVLIPLVVFLFFNFSFFKLPKLFLGDGGSLLLGFIIAFVLIYLSKMNKAHPILLAWTIVIFVYEFLAVNLIRLKNNKKIFLPQKDHLHHLLFFKTNSIFLTNFFIILINILCFLIGYFSFNLINPLTSLILFPIMFLVYILLRIRFLTLNKKNNFVIL